MEGQAVPVGQLLPEGFNGVSSKLGVPPYDPARARRLLAEAGYPEGFRLVLRGPNNRYLNDASSLQAIAQMFSRIGVQSTVEAAPWVSFRPLIGSSSFSVALFGWASSTGETGLSLNALLGTKDAALGRGVPNGGQYSNPRLDSLVEEAMGTIDSNARGALLAEATELAMQDVALIPLFYAVSTWACRNGVQFDPPSNEPMAVGPEGGSGTMEQALNAALRRPPRRLPRYDAMIVAPQPEAVEAGAGILRGGGNAVDAALACAFAQGVVDPMMCGLGGFGVLHVFDPRRGEHIILDGLSAAPLAAHPEMWVDDFVRPGSDGFGFVVRGNANEMGHRAVTTPGILRVLSQAHARFGRLPWSNLFDPAVAPEYIRVLAEAMKIAGRDKNRHIGDPRFVPPPLDQLLSADYIASCADTIRRGEKTPLDIVEMDAKETTTLSCVDGDGMVVSLTHTLGTSSGVIPPGTGFMLNGGMNAFDPRPGRAGSIAPGKRRFSTMAPYGGVAITALASQLDLRTIRTPEMASRDKAGLWPAGTARLPARPHPPGGSPAMDEEEDAARGGTPSRSRMARRKACQRQTPRQRPRTRRRRTGQRRPPRGWMRLPWTTTWPHDELPALFRDHTCEPSAG
jgi:hypothetical protein